jgi:RNA polymerase sigma factor (sigma-70 family)
MEAARTLIDLPERIRRHRFTAACEELRPLGIAYVLRQFGQSLDRADAEDVVAEVIIRLDRLDAAGRPPDRLRPAFFTSVRNAALDLLRYRGVRPTAPLEAAASAASEVAGPEEKAESQENVVRLREAMARMRPNYREAIVLRFGLGLTVPEIAERLQISLPAAKKLVLRSTAQIRDRMEAIDGRRFCPEMQLVAERSVLDGELAGIADSAQAAAIRAHLEHCGPCRGFLASLRSDLHSLGGLVLLGGVAGRSGLPGRLLSVLHVGGHHLQAGVHRVRLASYRAAGALPTEGGGSAGLLAGTGQKIAAVCTAGAVGTATCVATGIVGPGLGLTTRPAVHHPPARPVAQVRSAPKPRHRAKITYLAPDEKVASEPVAPTGSTAGTVPSPRGHSTPAAEPAKPKHHEKKTEEPATEEPATPEQTEQTEFGIEEEAAPSSAEAAPVESATPDQERVIESSVPSSSSSSSSGGGSKSSGAASGQEEFGFGG